MNACKMLIGKPESEKILGIPRRGWENHIKLDFKRIGCEGVDWIQVARDGCAQQVLWIRKRNFGFHKGLGI
jgi:hypothetical protein